MKYEQERVNKSWLITAMLEPLDNVERSFFYDKQCNHFFHLTPLDFLAFAEGCVLKTNHSKSDADMLRNKLGRLRAGDDSTVPIPRSSNEDRVAIQLRFVNRFIGMYLYYDLYEKY